MSRPFKTPKKRIWVGLHYDNLWFSGWSHGFVLHGVGAYNFYNLETDYVSEVTVDGVKTLQFTRPTGTGQQPQALMDWD